MKKRERGKKRENEERERQERERVKAVLTKILHEVRSLIRIQSALENMSVRIFGQYPDNTTTTTRTTTRTTRIRVGMRRKNCKKREFIKYVQG